MQEHDLLLAGDPASIQPAREHTLGGVQANRERYWEKGDLANAPLTIRPRQRLPPASLQPKRPSAEKVLQSFNTWAFKREQPSDPQLMLCTIARAIRFSRPLSFALYWGKGPRCSVAEPDIQCMVRPCGARGFVDPGDAVLHQCIRPLIGACAPGPHGHQRACDLISGPASNGLFGSPVFARAGKTDPPSSSHPLADLGG